MNKSVRFLSVAAVATFAAFGAHADEALRTGQISSGEVGSL